MGAGGTPGLAQSQGLGGGHDHSQQSQGQSAGTGNGGGEYSNHSNYLDANWASSFLMDSNQDMLYGMDFSASSMGMGTGASNSQMYSQGMYMPSGMNVGMIQKGSEQLQEHQITPQQQNIQPQMQSQPPQGPPPVSILPSNKTSHQTPSQTSPPPNSNNANNSTASNTPVSTNPSTAVPNKGSKIRRPCDHCRRRKTKCVIIPGTNNCAQCESKSLVCTYIDQPARRPPGNGASSYGDENNNKNNNINNSNDSINNMNYNPNKRSKTSKDENPNLAILQAGSLGENSTSHLGSMMNPNVVIRDVLPVQDYSMVNNSLLKKTLSLQFPRSSFYVGPTSYVYDVNLLNLIIDSQNNASKNEKKGSTNGNGGKIEQINLSDNISLRKVSEKTQFVLKDDQSPQSYLTMSNDVDTIEKFIAPHGQILIDLYFRIIHPSYPILHKKVFLEKYSRTHREFGAPLLAAVYVLAIQWWDYDPQLNRYPKPDSELILKIAVNNYLLEILKRPKLSAVQAGLLLLQCKHILQSRNLEENKSNRGPAANSLAPGGDADFNDWVLCSQVTSLAEELGLGLDCHGWKLPKWERGLRKRLAWAVYMEDKWLSLKNARPSHIHNENWIVLPLADEDFPEKHGDGDLKEGSSDIDNGKKIFRNLIDLTMILSDIVEQFYSMKAMNEITDINQVLRLAKPLQLRLRNWYHSLPIELQMNSVQPRKLCSNGYLQLAYFATELTLHRKIVTTIYQQFKTSNPPAKELVHVCRTAAKTRLLASIEFVRDLKPEHIHSFWHSSASSSFTLIGTFASILFISSVNKEEEAFYKDQVFNYRWILKISSKGFDQVGSALQKLDLVLNHIPGLLIDKAGLPMVVPNVPTIDYNAQKSGGYNNNNNTNNKTLQSNQGSPQNQQSPLIQGSLSGGGGGGAAGAGIAAGAARNRMRMNPQQQRPQGTPSNNSYMSSPQHFHTPMSANNNAQAGNAHQTISRGGQFVINSPQSSQGLSPKEIIKQQRPVSWMNGEDNNLSNGDLSQGQSINESENNSYANPKASPSMSNSPSGPLSAPTQSDDNLSINSEHK